MELKRNTIYLAMTNENIESPIKNNVFAFSVGESQGREITIRTLNENNRIQKEKMSKEKFEEYKFKIEETNLPSFTNNEKYWEKYLKNANSKKFDLTESVYSTSIDVINEPEFKHRIVIETELRKLYKKNGHIDITAEEIGKLFLDAIEELALYENINEDFANKNRKENLIKNDYTIKLQKYFEKNERENRSIVFGNSVYSYLGKEIAFLRTTRGITKEGESAKKSGSGGVDCLFVNENKEIVILEYKSCRDSSLYYALIQGLTYCSEAVTKNQMLRIKKHFTEIVSDKIELCIMFDSKDERKKESIENVYEMAKTVYTFINEYISKISFVSVEEDNENYIFKLEREIG